jgi:hypothetical protein
LLAPLSALSHYSSSGPHFTVSRLSAERLNHLSEDRTAGQRHAFPETLMPSTNHKATLPLSAPPIPIAIPPIPHCSPNYRCALCPRSPEARRHTAEGGGEGAGSGPRPRRPSPLLPLPLPLPGRALRRGAEAAFVGNPGSACREGVDLFWRKHLCSVSEREPFPTI